MPDIKEITVDNVTYQVKDEVARSMASGGGGGKTWELIKEITVSEPVFSLTINKDSNDEPFQLKEVMLICTFEKGETTNLLKIFIEGDGNRNNIFSLENTGAFSRRVVAHYEVGPSNYLIPARVYYSYGSSYANVLNNIGTNSLGKVITLRYIESISMSCYNASSIAANSKIEVYGVRA